MRGGGLRRGLMSGAARVGNAFRVLGDVFTPAIWREKIEEVQAAERQARLAQERLRGALDALPEGIVLLDPEGRYILWNEKYAEIYSGSSDLFEVGAKLEDTLRVGVARGNYPEALGREEEWLAARLDLLANPGARHEQQIADGRWIMIEERKTPDGGNIGIRVDITELKETTAALEDTRTFLDAIVERMPAVLFVTDPKTGAFLVINEAGEEVLGLTRQEVLGKTYADLFPHDQAVRLSAYDRELTINGGVLVIEDEEFEHADGGMRTLHIRKSMIRDAVGAPQYILAVCEDVTQHRASEARIAHIVQHDALTDLPNRILFHDRLTRGLGRIERDGGLMAVLCIDLDQFKTVNDTLGHPVGDALLQIVSQRLTKCVREGDTVARLGGDEFAVIQHNLDSADDAGRLAQRIVESLSHPCEVLGHQVITGASVGVALAPTDGSNAEDLLKKADMALYRTKADGRGAYRYFEPEMDARMKTRRLLELDLRRGLAEGQFELHYQPLFDLAADRISGCEALVRWNHPTRGLVMPGEFIALAEEIGLIIPLGEWALKQACAEAAAWPEHMKVAVNLSPVQFRSRNLVQTVVQALASSGLTPGRLELEITESVLLHETAGNMKVLHELRELGVRIAMDDFGTGYSSLSYLRSFPFDKIKIDRSFISDLAGDPDALAIVKAVTSLGAGLNIITTAEGVETADQMEQLRLEGCTEVQGYLISRPCNVAALREMIGAPLDQPIKAKGTVSKLKPRKTAARPTGERAKARA
jgi:diguanylate cyclase (GGDEF)-like protein/PAS domain S-box-containing protein